MDFSRYDNFFLLLRIALGCPGASVGAFPRLSADEWERIYNEADRQTLLGLAFDGVMKLPQELRPPMELMFQWASEAETVRGLNELLNKECALQTNFFEKENFQTAILKGQANARLYPNPLCRQPGDIDIWVSGGKKRVVEFLGQHGLKNRGYSTKHHVHLPKNKDGVDVEVHFTPSSGNMNPFSTRRLVKFLNGELSCRERTPEGYYVPNVKFALAMQLSHVHRHFVTGGVGLRQLLDYYILLRSSSVEDRNEISRRLGSLGLSHAAAAIMWVLRQTLGLDESLMLCKPDSFRGEWMLKDILKNGNFGYHSEKVRLKWLYWWFGKRRDSLKYFRYDAVETIWAEIAYWIDFFSKVSLRIKYRRISLRDIQF
ncbi:MAG: nucleotidyltransferase family protein [Fibrobacter sp.]|nr:nucleotidyltransferase family protein [Fibrobacter sp.]